MTNSIINDIRHWDMITDNMLKSYKELKLWDKAYKLCLEIYKITRRFPSEEKYGLSLQIRRSSVSIPSNIAEGYGSKSTQEYIYHLYIPYGSYCELETQILLSIDLGYVKDGIKEKILEMSGEAERMLKALINSLEAKTLESSTP